MISGAVWKRLSKNSETVMAREKKTNKNYILLTLHVRSSKSLKYRKLKPLNI